MDIHIYQENTRKVKGEDVTVLLPIGVLEGFEDEETALEALLDADESFLGVELVIFTQEPVYITPEEPTTKYAFKRRNGSGAVVEGDEEAAEEEYEEEEPEAEEEALPPAPKRRPPSKSAAKKPPAKKPAAAKRPASKAGTRTSSGGRRTPFTKNAASAE